MPNNKRPSNPQPSKQKSDGREIAGVTLMIVSLFFLLCLIYPPILVDIGQAIYKVSTGLLGIFAYAFFIILLLWGYFLLRNYKLVVSRKRAAFIVVLSLLSLMLLQAVFTHKLLAQGSFTGYIDALYGNFKENLNPGGIIFGIFVYAIVALIKTVGCYILLGLLMLLFGALLVLDITGLRKSAPRPAKKPGSRQFSYTNQQIAPVKPVGAGGLFTEKIIPHEREVREESGSFSEINNDIDMRAGASEPKSYGAAGLRGFFESMSEDNPENVKLKADALSTLYADRDKMLEDSKSRFMRVVNKQREIKREDLPKSVSAGPDIRHEKPNDVEVNLKKGGQAPLEVIFPPQKDTQPKFFDGEIIDAESFSRNIKMKETAKFISEDNETYGDPETFYDAGYDFQDKTAEARIFLGGQADSGDDLDKDLDGGFNGFTGGNMTPPKKTQAAPHMVPDPTADDDSGIINCDDFTDDTDPYSGSTIELTDDFVFNTDMGKPRGDGVFAEKQDDTPWEEPVTEIKPAGGMFKGGSFFGGVLKSDEIIEEDTEEVQEKPVLGEIEDCEQAVEELQQPKKEFKEPSQEVVGEIEFEPAEVELPPETETETAVKPEKSAKPQEEKQDNLRLVEGFKKLENEKREVKRAAAKDEPKSDESDDDADGDFTGYYVKEQPKTQGGSFLERISGIEKKLSPKNQINMDTYLAGEGSAEKPRRRRTSKYMPPPVSLLKLETGVNYGAAEEYRNSAMLLEEALRNLKLPAKVIDITPGPQVVRYELEMPTGAPVKRIQSCAQDISYALASNRTVRIEAPIPGKRAVGVEVPKKAVDKVCLRELLESPEFGKATSPLTMAVGKDVASRTVLCNLEKMPHLLIAGSTGSGKSVCIHSLIISMLYKSSPSEVRFVLIDPKLVEFSMYKGLPHLLINEVITDRDQALNAFKWLREEVESRYNIFLRCGARNLGEYNMSEAVKSGEEEKLPYIVLIVDELSDLMMLGYKKEMEDHILSLSQKARAAGVHLILATQRPSVDVITGTIKVNLVSRIALTVGSAVDSKIILDQVGAETLLGYGDLLYMPNGSPDPMRVQGAYVSTDEAESIIRFIKENNTAEYYEEAHKAIMRKKVTESENDEDVEHDTGGFDFILEEVVRKIIETNQASTSMLQRRFKLGYARASRIMDQLEELRFVGPMDMVTKRREVYITRETFREFFGKDY